MYKVNYLNKISPVGTKLLTDQYTAVEDMNEADAVLVRSAAMHDLEFSENLLAAGTLKAPMLKALPATFSWPQLFTALIGGAVALVIVPVLRKALHK